jgi:hypothetical protein
MDGLACRSRRWCPILGDLPVIDAARPTAVPGASRSSHCPVAAIRIDSHMLSWESSSGAGDGNRTRTISLGTGLSCFADHGICSSETIYIVRECPLQTVSDRPIGHATGTSPDWQPTGSARRCCYKCRRHVGYRTQDPERRDLCDLLQASLLRNLHRRLLRHSFVLVIVAKTTNHDVAAERDEEQQRGSRQRRAQPADRPTILPGRRRSVCAKPSREG